MLNFFRDIFRILGVFGALLVGACVVAMAVIIGTEILDPLLKPTGLSTLKILSFFGHLLGWFWPVVIGWLILWGIFKAICNSLNTLWQRRTGYVVKWQYLSEQGDPIGMEVTYEENGNFVRFRSSDYVLRLPDEGLWQQMMPAFIAHRRMEVLIRMRNRIPDSKVTFHHTLNPHEVASISQ